MRQHLIRPAPIARVAYENVALENSSVVAGVAVSLAGEVLAANSRFAAAAGAASAKELVGAKLTDLLVEGQDWGRWRRACLEGRGKGVSLILRGSGSQPVLLKGDLSPAGRLRGKEGAVEFIAGAFVDVSEEHKLRQAVQRGARMEALGSLTSGIAHDFNNLLTVLVGNLYLVAEELRGQPKIFQKLKAARDAAKRGSDLIRQLLAFARRENVDTDVVDPIKIIDGLVPLLGRALGSRIELQTKLGREAGSIPCNAGQLESVVVNLSVNARDAINAKEGAPGGRVVIAVEPVELSSQAAREGLAAGAYFRIAVTDDGCGIPDTVLSRVFEPFFTTKGEQGGTGLGLSMVRWFAEQAGGGVRIKSEVGEGTTVSLLLPRVDRCAETTSKTMPLSQLPTGRETILVLSREEQLRSTMRQILEVLGYTVRLSADPSEALRTLKTADIDMLLVDAAVQQAHAREQLLRQALSLRPPLKILVAADGAEAKRAAEGGGTALLAKPFTLADLANAVRRAFA